PNPTGQTPTPTDRGTMRRPKTKTHPPPPPAPPPPQVETGRGERQPRQRLPKSRSEPQRRPRSRAAQPARCARTLDRVSALRLSPAPPLTSLTVAHPGPLPQEQRERGLGGTAAVVSSTRLFQFKGPAASLQWRCTPSAALV